MANSKSKRKPRQQPSPGGALDPSRPVAGDLSEIRPEKTELKPVTPQPRWFMVSSAALIVWLVFLAFVAYRVMFS